MARKRGAAEIEALYKKLEKIKKKLEVIESESDLNESGSENNEAGSKMVTEAEIHNDGQKDLVENNDSEKENERSPTTEQTMEPDLSVDENIIELLGEDPQKSKALEVELHPSLSLCWNYWVLNGLEKQVKEDLLRKYKRSAEFEAPKLNVEISTILNENAIKRDQFMSENQNLAGSALIAIGSALSMIMNNEEEVDKLTFVERLNDAAKLIMEIHHSETDSRKAFIYPGINKNVKTVLTNAKTDSFLFGKELKGKIQEANNLDKLSKNIKNPVFTKTPTHQSKQYLNYKSLPGKRPFPNQAGASNYQGQYRPKLAFRTRPQYNNPKAQNQRPFRPPNKAK